MVYENLLVEKLDGGVGIITLNRPEVLNALSAALMHEYDAALEAFDADDAVSCIVVTGSGERAFSSGADVKEPRTKGQESTLGSRSWDRANLTKPTIGALNGLAYGGGAMISVELDIRIGCDRTRFRFPQTTFGWVGATWSLPMVIGWVRAKELLYTARVVEPEEAAQMGLLNRVVPADQVLGTAVEMARQIAQNKPAAVQGVKRLLAEHIGRTWAQMVQAERGFKTDRLGGTPPHETAYRALMHRKGLKSD